MQPDLGFGLAIKLAIYLFFQVKIIILSLLHLIPKLIIDIKLSSYLPSVAGLCQALRTAFCWWELL